MVANRAKMMPETYDSEDDEDQDGLWEWFLTGVIGHGAEWF